MRRDALEPARDLRYPTRADDPAWRAWYRAASAPVLPPPGRPTLTGRTGPTPQVTLRLPQELRHRAVRLARWRRTSLAAIVRRALEHHLDEGVDGRAGRPHPHLVRAGASSGTLLDPHDDVLLAQGYADAAVGVVAEEE